MNAHIRDIHSDMVLSQTLFRRSTFAPLFLAAACQTAPAKPAPASGVGADVAVLASLVFGGREAGTAGGDTAAEFLAGRYQDLGARPAFTVGCAPATACPRSYFQLFDLGRGAQLAHNVGAIIDGTDSVMRVQFIVMAAHFDGLGSSPTYALDRDRGFVLRPGADDNASGTAGVLELARRLHQRPPRRSILIVNFDAEELGLVGSGVFLNHPPVPRQAMIHVVNLDMIGRLRDNRLFVEGARGRPIHAVIDSAAAANGLRVDYVPNQGRSDHATFLDAGIDAVMLSTGNHVDYHAASDIVPRVDVVGMERVIDVAERIVRELADRRTTEF